MQAARRRSTDAILFCSNRSHMVNDDTQKSFLSTGMLPGRIYEPRYFFSTKCYDADRAPQQNVQAAFFLSNNYQHHFSTASIIAALPTISQTNIRIRACFPTKCCNAGRAPQEHDQACWGPARLLAWTDGGSRAHREGTGASTRRAAPRPPRRAAAALPDRKAHV